MNKRSKRKLPKKACAESFLQIAFLLFLASWKLLYPSIQIDAFLVALIEFLLFLSAPKKSGARRACNGIRA